MTRILPLLCAVWWAGCAQPASDPSIITVAIYAAPNNLDPRYGTDTLSSRAQQLLFNDLLTLDARMRIAPGLAESWQTDDDRVYRLALRRGVAFHDGHELTSRDVVYTFETILDPASASPLRGAYRQLEHVTAIDRYTVEFALSEPSGAFLINLVVKIVPDGAGRELRDHPVGTGPYTFVSYSPDDRLVVRANPEYFEGLPRNRGVVLKVVPDDIMRALELRKRTTDLVVNDMVPDIAYQLEKDGLQLITAPGATYQYLGFNMRDPLLADRRVRHAIGYAIDRAAIVEHLRRGLATPAVGILTPNNWAFEPEVFEFAYDPARARALLDEAGYPDPDGEGPLPRFALALKVSNTEFNRLQSAVIQQDLRAIGIDVDVRAYEFATLHADIVKGSFQLFTLQWAGGASADPDILRRLFHSRQVPPAGFNRGFVNDAELDALIDAASSATSPEERRIRYGRVQQHVAELAPYISLWYETNLALAQPELRGVQLSPHADFGFLRNVSR